MRKNKIIGYLLISPVIILFGFGLVYILFKALSTYEGRVVIGVFCVVGLLIWMAAKGEELINRDF